MGVISRFADIMKANINDLLDKAEDPSKMIDQALRDAQESLMEVKKETAGVMAEENRCRRNLDEARVEVKKWTDYAQKALKAGNEGDARTFIAKKQTAEGVLASAEKTYQAAKANADKMRQMHDKLVNDINQMNAKREELKAKIAVAKTQDKLNKATSKINTSGAMGAFDRMEQRANNMLDRAMAEAELNTQPMDEAAELADKYDSGSSGSVDDELERMKREMGL